MEECCSGVDSPVPVRVGEFTLVCPIIAVGFEGVYEATEELFVCWYHRESIPEV